MKLFFALLAALTIPALALGVASLPYVDDLQLREPLEIVDIATFCLFEPQANFETADACRSLQYYNWLGLGAVVTGGIGLALVLFVLISGLIAGRSRKLLAATFSTVSFISLAVMAVILTSQAFLLVGLIVLLEIYFLEVIHYYVVIIGLLGATAVTIAAVTSLFQMLKRSTSGIAAMPLENGQGSELVNAVHQIAEDVGTKPPDNILVGLEPSFFVTSSPLATPFKEKDIKGRTLYLSLPLMRVLSTDETRSIIGHEMAHFSGGDTTYSKFFAPAYRALSHAKQNMLGDRIDAFSLMALPGFVIVDFILGTFAPAERRISREREFRADGIGAQIGSAEALSTSLVKLATFDAIWQQENVDSIQRVRLGRGSRNLVRSFVDRGRYDTDLDQMAKFTAESLEQETSHPFDTHPKTKSRIEALGLEPSRFTVTDVFKASLFPKNSLSEQCIDLNEIEETMSAGYQQIIVQQFGVDQRDEVKFESAFSNFLSMWLARMVTIDGSVDEEEIFTAQSEAAQYDPAFDATSFREFCRHPEDIPETQVLIEAGNKMLNTGGAERLRGVLQKIAAADGVLHPEEQALLELLDAELVGLDDEVTTASEVSSSKKRRRRR